MHTSLIVVDPEIQSGKPVFVSTRVPIQNLFDYIEEGDSLNVFLAQFPSVTREMAVAVLEQAQTALVQQDAHPA
jgi:uncharacterized protein (DUF433 family)